LTQRLCTSPPRSLTVHPFPSCHVDSRVSCRLSLAPQFFKVAHRLRVAESMKESSSETGTTTRHYILDFLLARCHGLMLITTSAARFRSSCLFLLRFSRHGVEGLCNSVNSGAFGSQLTNRQSSSKSRVRQCEAQPLRVPHAGFTCSHMNSRLFLTNKYVCDRSPNLSPTSPARGHAIDHQLMESLLGTYYSHIGGSRASPGNRLRITMRLWRGGVPNDSFANFLPLALH
jgi:hypothetical protein